MWFEFSQWNWMVMQISRESIPGSRCRKWKTSTSNVHSFYEEEQEAGQSWQIEAEDVPQLHQPECNVLPDNLVPIHASTCMSWHTVYMLFAVRKWASATVFSRGPWHSHDQEAARWVELQISKRTAVVWPSQLKIQQVRRYNNRDGCVSLNAPKRVPYRQSENVAPIVTGICERNTHWSVYWHVTSSISCCPTWHQDCELWWMVWSLRRRWSWASSGNGGGDVENRARWLPSCPDWAVNSCLPSTPWWHRHSWKMTPRVYTLPSDLSGHKSGGRRHRNARETQNFP